MPGPNVAPWQSAILVAGAGSPPVAPPLSLSLGLGAGLEHQWAEPGDARGPSGTYVVEGVFSLADPLRWQAVQMYSTSNWSFRFDFADSGATNYGRALLSGLTRGRPHQHGADPLGSVHNGRPLRHGGGGVAAAHEPARHFLH